MTYPMMASKGRILLWGAAFVLLWAAPAHAEFTGPVVSVLDGDTIEVLHNTQPERVWLSGIDGTEKGQAFRKRAKQAALELVFEKESPPADWLQLGWYRCVGELRPF